MTEVEVEISIEGSQNEDSFEVKQIEAECSCGKYTIYYFILFIIIAIVLLIYQPELFKQFLRSLSLCYDSKDKKICVSTKQQLAWKRRLIVKNIKESN